MRHLNIQIQTVSACSGKCIFCPYFDSWHKHYPGRMSDFLFSRIIDQLTKFDLGKICPYLENEPLLDPKLFSRIAIIKKRLNFRMLEVSTNANELNANAAEKLADLLTDVPHEIWISFHGIDKRTHEGIMGLDYDRCLENTIRIMKLSEQTPLRIIIRGAGVGLSNKLKHDFEFDEKSYIQFWEMQFKRHGLKKRPGINWFQYHDRAGAIKCNGIRLGRNVRHDLMGFSCSRVGDWLHVLYTGELTICCMDYNREEIFGDLRTQDLAEILAGPTYRHLRDRVEGRAPSAPDFICKRCISPGG